VTTGASGVLRTERAGSLRRGGPADLIVVRPSTDDPYEAITSASRADVALVMVDGRCRVGSPQLATVFAHLGTRAVEVVLDGSPRLLERWIARRASRLRLREPGLEVPRC
jgi:hypothetical protein